MVHQLVAHHDASKSRRRPPVGIRSVRAEALTLHAIAAATERLSMLVWLWLAWPVRPAHAVVAVVAGPGARSEPSGAPHQRRRVDWAIGW
jgi:hypothetical protein